LSLSYRQLSECGDEGRGEGNNKKENEQRLSGVISVHKSAPSSVEGVTGIHLSWKKALAKSYWVAGGVLGQTREYPFGGDVDSDKTFASE
jgi:hypothetical protein